MFGQAWHRMAIRQHVESRRALNSRPQPAVFRVVIHSGTSIQVPLRLGFREKCPGQGGSRRSECGNGEEFRLLSGIDWRQPQKTWRPTSVGHGISCIFSATRNSTARCAESSRRARAFHVRGGGCQRSRVMWLRCFPTGAILEGDTILGPEISMLGERIRDLGLYGFRNATRRAASPTTTAVPREHNSPASRSFPCHGHYFLYVRLSS